MKQHESAASAPSEWDFYDTKLNVSVVFPQVA